MQRLTKVGKIPPKSSNEIKQSHIGIGFEKLDRDVFDPEKAYDKVAAIGVKWVRIPPPRNGSACLVFRSPKNILTTDRVGTTSFRVITKQKKVRLADLCNGDVYTVPDTILTDYGDGCLRFDHLPVTDRPMALLFGNFCDWSENV